MSNGIIRELFAAQPETRVFSSATRGRTINKILIGTWAGVVQDDGGARVRVRTAGPDGWVNRG